MRVLVTGHRGYLGSVMAGVLRHAHFDVVGMDCDLYQGCDFGRVRSRIPDFQVDLREIEFSDLLSFDAVIHLAALPVPVGRDSTNPVDPSLLEETNVEATLRLAHCCKQAKVSRFLFASTCEVYRQGVSNPLDEESPVEPATFYAASKLLCEQELARMADRSFAPVFLRNADAYGVSPRLRLDLVINGFVAAATTTGRIAVHPPARAWRSLLHVEDIARSYAAVLSAPDELIHNEVFNVADSNANYRIAETAEAVTEWVTNSDWTAAPQGSDRRSHRIDGSKLRRTFENLTFHWDLPLGIRQLHTAMLSAGLTEGDLRSGHYDRQSRLHTLIDRGQLDCDLRRTREWGLANAEWGPVNADYGMVKVVG